MFISVFIWPIMHTPRLGSSCVLEKIINESLTASQRNSCLCELSGIVQVLHYLRIPSSSHKHTMSSHMSSQGNGGKRDETAQFTQIECKLLLFT